jgi:hypothetical protein
MSFLEKYSKTPTVFGLPLLLEVPDAITFR